MTESNKLTGNELKEIRLSLGLEQTEMCKRLHSPLTTYRNWERKGTVLINNSTLKIAVQEVARLRRAEISPSDLEKLSIEARRKYELRGERQKHSKEESLKKA